MSDLSTISRRAFLHLGASSIGLGWLASNFSLNRLLPPLAEQIETWQQVDCSVDLFWQRYGDALTQLRFGANLCPDYRLFAADADPARAVRILKERFGCTAIRLATRWSTHVTVGIDAYDRWIEALLRHDMAIVIAYGVKAPFPPETHFPPAIEASLSQMGVTKESTVHADSPLGQRGLNYSRTLLEHLSTTFGLASFAGFNVENEFDAHYGIHKLAIGEDLLRAQVALLHGALGKHTDGPQLLLNTAIISPPGQPASLTTTVRNALALQQQFANLHPVVGLDIYEETGSGRIGPDWYIDTFAGVRLRHGDSLIPQALRTLAANAIGLEVTEFQLSDWISEPRRFGPGSRIHMQYLLARMSEYLLSPGPFQGKPIVARLWEMSKLLLELLADEHSFAENDAYRLIRRINQMD